MDPINLTTKAVGWTAKKIAAVVIAAACAVGGGAAITTTVIANRPMNLVASALEKSVDKAQDSGVVSTVKDIFEGGSVEISGNLGNLAEAYAGIDSEDLDADVSVKFYSDMKKSKMAVVTSFGVEGSEVLDASAFFTGDDIVVSSEALLPGAYGINLKELEKTFDDSVFGEDGAFPIGISVEEIAELRTMFDELDKNGKALEKVIKGIYGEFGKSVMKNAEVKKENGSLDFADKACKTTDVKITVDEESLVKIVEDVLKYMQKDKKLKNYIDDYLSAEAFEALQIKNFEGFSSDDFYDALDMMLDNIDDLESELGEFEATVTFSVAKSSHEMVGVAFVMEVEDEEMFDVSFKCGPTWKNFTEMEFSVDNVGGERVKGRINYTVSENTKKQYSADFAVKQDGAKLAEADIDWDKSSGDLKIDYNAEVGSGPDEITFKGNLTKKGSVTSLVLGSISLEGDKIDLGDIKITVNSKDKVPDPPKYTDIMTMTEDDLEALGADIEEKMNELAEEFGDMFGEFLPTFDSSDFDPDDDWSGDDDWGDDLGDENGDWGDEY